jgi:hypothetical protein
VQYAGQPDAKRVGPLEFIGKHFASAKEKR